MRVLMPGAILGCVILGAPVVHAQPPEERWPVWPTEVDITAASLYQPKTRASEERERENAIRELERFATEVIEDEIVHALDDPAPQVRREALRVCYERRIRACSAAAAAVWSKGIEPTLRIAALKVLATHPEPSHVAILLSALRDTNEQIRAEAAQFLGWAPLRGSAREDARTALVAKLGDLSALVRRRAIESLGLLGAPENTLALARLLEDPEPTVRAAAAQALALSGDVGAVPALIRAIDGVNEAMVTKAMIEALAHLPGDEVARELLVRFDDPPNGLTSAQLAEALGNRPQPERVLVDGLIARLGEEDLSEAAMHALLLMADAAKEALVDARARGLPPPVAIEVQRLIAAIEGVRKPRPYRKSWPAPDDHQGWVERLSFGDPRDRLDAAVALARTPPAWIQAAVTGQVERRGPIASRRPWIFLLALSQRKLELDPLVLARLKGWAGDTTLAPDDRCLAIAALGAATQRLQRRSASTALRSHLTDPDPVVRSCAALALARVDPDAGPQLETMLLDTAARVRASAALGLAMLGPQPTAVARLGLLRARDLDPQVRSAAELALGQRLDPRPAAVRIMAPDVPWSELPQWAELKLGERRLWVPLLGPGRERWAVVPGLGDAEVISPPPR